jgi:hypothetical protein
MNTVFEIPEPPSITRPKRSLNTPRRLCWMASRHADGHGDKRDTLMGTILISAMLMSAVLIGAILMGTAHLELHEHSKCLGVPQQLRPIAVRGPVEIGRTCEIKPWNARYSRCS